MPGSNVLIEIIGFEMLILTLIRLGRPMRLNNNRMFGMIAPVD